MQGEAPMDGHHFDNLLRELTNSRRSLLGAGLAALLGGMSATDSRISAKGKGKKKKKKKTPPPPLCGPSNCDGCCNGNTCVAKDNSRVNTACGIGGAPCETCNPNVRCDQDRRTCVCDEQSCFGCCTEDRKTCRDGDDDNACGKDGDFCQDCTTQSRTCDASTRVCSPTACTPDCPEGQECVNGSCCPSNRACLSAYGGQGACCTYDDCCQPQDVGCLCEFDGSCCG